jgi:hypothetical protein
LYSVWGYVRKEGRRGGGEEGGWEEGKEGKKEGREAKGRGKKESRVRRDLIGDSDKLFENKE